MFLRFHGNFWINLFEPLGEKAMIYIFLPAYNEEIALPRLVKKFDEVLRQASESLS